jgi:protoporphyrinogen oxidase
LSLKTPVVILGAGPAGVGAAYRLGQRGLFDVTVLERQKAVGGNAGSFDVAGLQVDFGSHRLHPSCAPPILDDIRGLLGDDLLDRPRHGRMRIRGRWVHFPLKPLDLGTHLPLSFSFGVLRDTAKKITKTSGEETFESILQRGLGETICRDFYFPYARKIWGVSPQELDAEQARRRVSAGSLSKMIRKVMRAVPGFKAPGAGRFYYPRNGFGQISKAYACAALRAGAEIRFDTTVKTLKTERGRVVSVETEPESLPARHVLSTIPITALVRSFGESAPGAVLKAADALRFRSMVLAYLVLETEQFTEFDAHYFPSLDIPMTRMSEPKNYGCATLPGKTVLCAEFPCTLGDDIWNASEEQIGNLVRQGLVRSDIPIKAPVEAVLVRRIPQAYPIYKRDYRNNFDVMDEWLNTINGLLTLGRQGLFAHDNTHHTLAMAYAASDCLDAEGQLDRARWQQCRREFEHHVVED